MKHKHAEVIKAWADGAEIEFLTMLGTWVTIKYPDWDDRFKYRVKPEPDPYAELKAAHAAGKTIQCYSKYNKEWITLSNPIWGTLVSNYRVKPEVDPYAELKAAHAAGKIIQMQEDRDGKWIDVSSWATLSWDASVSSYRIKPDPFAELKAAWKAGKTIQFAFPGESWDDWVGGKDREPKWSSPVSYYRIKPEEVDPFAKLKAAYKAGKAIQFNLGDKQIPNWTDFTFEPCWTSDISKYRIKPEEVDPYAELKAAHAAGKVLQVRRSRLAEEWTDVPKVGLNWNLPPSCYRIKPEADPFTELKAAYKAGKAIQVKTSYADWCDTKIPCWLLWNSYRVKPEPQHTYYKFKWNPK
jgi:hypothetical protein